MKPKKKLHIPNAKLKIFLLALGIMVSIIFLAVGGWLTGTHFESYNTYTALQTNFYLHSGNNSPGFETYLSEYNVLAKANSWPIATYSLFAAGIAILLIGFLILTSSVISFWISKIKANKLSKQTNI